MRYTVYCLLLIGSLVWSCEPTVKSSMNYPETVKVDTVDEYFGTKIPDPYRWLEDDLSSERADWVGAQNQVTFSYLKQIPFRQRLVERLTTLFDYERVSKPEKYGQYEYFFKNDGLQNQSVWYRRKMDGETAEVFLDPNTFSSDGTVSIAGYDFTTDGQLLAFMITEGGSDWRKAIVIDTDTRKVVEDTLENIKFSSLSWRGTEGFYYSSYDKPIDGSQLSGKTQYHKLLYHKLGTRQSSDELIFGGRDNPWRYISGYTSQDERYLIINAASSTSGQKLYIQDLESPNKTIVTLDDDEETEEYVVDTDGNRILIQTNKNAPNNKLVETTTEDPADWQTLIPEGKNVLTTTTGGNYIFAHYLEDAKTIVKQYNYAGDLVRDVELPGIGTTSYFDADKKERSLYYTFTSFTYPSSVFRYDLVTGISELYQKPDVDFSPAEFETRQVFYSSADGTQIPMFIVHKKDLQLNSKNPTYLYGYGGFNISLKPGFSISRMLWLENGGIYAQPGIRGGGEYGETWHKAGTKLQKQNVFDDFIAAAEYLIENKYTSSEYLAIAGGSNGGLLVGATMTQRPNLAKVALPAVGVMDMLRYDQFTAGAGWATDYGTSSESKEMFEYLLSYSPLHNLKSGTRYPATLVTTADHDDRVVPAHSFKFAATLQEAHSGDNPVLIRVETNSGHGAGTPISKTIEQMADRYAFTWYNMGIVPEIAKKDL